MRYRTRVMLLASIAASVTSVPFWGQEVTTISNTTNACITATYKFYSPSAAAPTLVFIDRRLNINPQLLCSTASNNSASCDRDASGGPNGEPLLIASATGAQISNGPFCNWNCVPAGCGTITTGPDDGLPVELMDFSVDDSERPSTEPKLRSQKLDRKG